jgi:hypothetical protein
MKKLGRVLSFSIGLGAAVALVGHFSSGMTRAVNIDHVKVANSASDPVPAPGGGAAPILPDGGALVHGVNFMLKSFIDSSAPQFAPAGSGKEGTSNGGASVGSSGFSDVIGVSQSKDTNVVDLRAGSDKQLQIVPKGQPANGSRVRTHVATVPANAVQATPTNPPKRTKPAAPPHQP